MSTTFRRTPSASRRISKAVLAGVATVSVLGLAACGNSSSSSSTTAAADPSSGGQASPAAGSCGSIPQVAPQDAQGVVKALPADTQQAYNGYQTNVAPSKWAHWKPSHAGPYKVAIIWNPPVNTFTGNVLDSMTSALKASGKVDIVSSTAPQSPVDVPGQIQLYNQAAAKKPDLIISFPLAAGPMVPAVDAAAKAGIPTVSPWVATPTPSAVSISSNNWLQAVELGSRVATQLNGTGSILQVHGIPSVAEDVEASAGFKSVLAQCPNLKLAGEVTGGYNPAAAKAAVLQFLSAHPGKIDGVFQSGTMTAGIIQAFQQLGRPVPAIADLGTTQGSVAYAHENKSSYQEHGSSTPDAAIGKTTATVVLNMLDGKNPTVDQLVTTPALIDNNNIDSVYQPGWTISSTDDAALPNDPWFSDQLLNSFFPSQ